MPTLEDPAAMDQDSPLKTGAGLLSENLSESQPLLTDCHPRSLCFSVPGRQWGTLQKLEVWLLSFQKWSEWSRAPMLPQETRMGSEIGEADIKSQANNR